MPCEMAIDEGATDGTFSWLVGSRPSMGSHGFGDEDERCSGNDGKIIEE